MQSDYRLGAGELTLNLTAVDFPEGETVISIDVNVGQVNVTLPAGVAAIADIDVRFGSADAFDQSFGTDDAGVDDIVSNGVESDTTVRLIVEAKAGDVQINQEGVRR